MVTEPISIFLCQNWMLLLVKVAKINAVGCMFNSGARISRSRISNLISARHTPHIISDSEAVQSRFSAYKVTDIFLSQKVKKKADLFASYSTASESDTAQESRAFCRQNRGRSAAEDR